MSNRSDVFLWNHISVDSWKESRTVSRVVTGDGERVRRVSGPLGFICCITFDYSIDKVPVSYGTG